MCALDTGEMVFYYHLELWVCYLIIFELYSAAPDQKEASKFSLSSMLNVAIPALMPPTTEYDRCESLKNFLGLTYDQLQEKNATELTDALTIDLITKDGTLKYDLTYRLGRILRNSTNIVILIHGFMESSDGWMVQAVAPVLLRRKEYKVLALDGRKIFFIDYLKSSTYVRFVGSKLGTVLAQIIKRGQDPSTITLVGHSLGAHLAGIAGKTVTDLTGRKLGRITGLDPAGPCFSTTTPVGRLDRSDAEYVDVVHTNGGLLGVIEPVGHKDFFPNGGLSQPGCYLSTCDHSRAWELFAESVNASRSFPARLCGNWSMFREGLCSRNEVSYLGLSSSPGTPGAYFLTTGSETPFGLGVAGSG